MKKQTPGGKGAAADQAPAPPLLLARAVAFAAERHVGQKLKGAQHGPYFNHLAEVAAIVAEATGGGDTELVAAAYLHDVVEDTATSEAEVRALFGPDVAGLVMEVTDDKSLPKAERKQLQIEHAPSLSGRAKVLKLADKISNVRSLTDSPPAYWSGKRKREYVAWARAVGAGLHNANDRLDRLFEETADRAEAALKD